MSSLLEQGKDELSKARDRAAEELRTRIPGRRSGPAAAVDKTTGRARRVAKLAESGLRKGAESARSVAKDGIERTRRGQRNRRRKRVGAAAAAGAAGGAGAYFLDPNEGKRRRDVALGRIKKLASNKPEPNDEALADRVRSEIFRPAEAPKGSVNVNVENGIVYLRGDADDPQQVTKLVEGARSVDGVREVKNLISTS